MNATTRKAGYYLAEHDGELIPATAEEVTEAYPSLSSAFGDLADKHRELVVCNTKGGVAVFRIPTGAEYDQFLGGLLDDRKAQKVKAGNILARSCVVFPEKATFASWLTEYPGIPGACVKPLNKLMGGELQERGKE